MPRAPDDHLRVDQHLLPVPRRQPLAHPLHFLAERFQFFEVAHTFNFAFAVGPDSWQSLDMQTARHRPRTLPELLRFTLDGIIFWLIIVALVAVGVSVCIFFLWGLWPSFYQELLRDFLGFR